MKNKFLSNTINYLIVASIFFLLIELFSYALYKINPGSIFGWQYYDEAFNQAKLPKFPYGWVSDEPMPRPGDVSTEIVCAAAFGDSFTYAEEVMANEAWANQASKLLGCKIENFGVGGFGTDQTYLLYKEKKPKVPIIIIGIYPEMLKRNIAASWIFYGSNKEKTLKPYFKVEDNTLIQYDPPQNGEVQLLKKYHENDYFYQTYKLTFPYSVSTAYSVFRHYYQRFLNKYNYVLKNDQAVILQNLIMDRLRTEVLNNGSKIVLIFYPTVAELENKNFKYIEYLNDYKARYPQDCVVDPGAALSNAMKDKNFKLNAGSGHYSKQGNIVVANEIARQIKSCKYLP